jgi:hypothetical protein
MNSSNPASGRLVLLALAAAILCSLAGCGPSLPPTYPVKGKAVMKGGKPFNLRDGSMITFQLASDKTVVAEGVIQKDGTFTLTTKMFGKTKPGAAEGEHNVFVVEGPPPGEALSPVYVPIIVSKTFKVVPGNNEFTVEVEKITRKIDTGQR